MLGNQNRRGAMLDKEHRVAIQQFVHQRGPLKGKFKGVTRQITDGRWLTTIWRARKTSYVGVFADIVEAARAYNEAALETFGADTYLNTVSSEDVNWDRRLGLVEVFQSPQGEGYNAGRMSIFLRLSGCNLDCRFADGSVCDTPWRKAQLKPTLREVLQTVESMLGCTGEELRRVDHKSKPMIVITGGEPTMSPAFDDLARVFASLGFYVAVESNGTIYKAGHHLLDWLCVSPKDGVDHIKPLSLPTVHPRIQELLSLRSWTRKGAGRWYYPGEYRYVIGADSALPPHYNAFRHYLSPAVLSDGSGKEWQSGFPGFVPGAIARCLELCQQDPRWWISIQQHKIIGVR